MDSKPLRSPTAHYHWVGAVALALLVAALAAWEWPAATGPQAGDKDGPDQTQSAGSAGWLLKRWFGLLVALGRRPVELPLRSALTRDALSCACALVRGLVLHTAILAMRPAGHPRWDAARRHGTTRDQVPVTAPRGGASPRTRR